MKTTHEAKRNCETTENAYSRLGNLNLDFCDFRSWHLTPAPDESLWHTIALHDENSISCSAFDDFFVPVLSKMSLIVAIVTVIHMTSPVQSMYQLKHFLSTGGRLPPRPPQRDIPYAVEEETPLGTQIGRGLRWDAGLDDRYTDLVLRTIRFQFLNNPPPFIDFSDVSAGILKTTGRVDREQLCTSTNVVVSGNQQHGGVNAGDLCRLKLDVAIQPMQYFEIIKVRCMLDLTFMEGKQMASIARLFDLLNYLWASCCMQSVMILLRNGIYYIGQYIGQYPN